MITTIKLNFKKVVSFAVILAIICTCTVMLVSCDGGSLLDKHSRNLTQYNISAVLGSDNTLSAKQEVRYINKTGVPLDSVLFHLYPNAYRGTAKNKPVHAGSSAKAYPNGFSEGGIDIIHLKVGDTQVPVKLGGDDGHYLIVALPNQLTAGSAVEITIGFALTIPNIAHRFGYGDNTTNLGNWYPIVCVYESGRFITDPYSPNGDPFYSDTANYTVSLAAPSNMVLASTGEIKDVKIAGNNTAYLIEAKAVRDFAMVLSSKFNTVSQKVKHTTISYFYYNDENPAKFLNTAIDAISTFGKLFGEYPYSTLNVAKANFLHGGMEYPNLVYISDSIANDSEYQHVIIHEIAHQWWYGLVGSNAVSHPWLDEGLTEFSTALFYKHNSGYENSYQEVIGNALNAYLLFCDVYSSFYGSVNSNMRRNLYEYTTEPEYVYMTYVRGLLMFDSVYEAIGEKKMLAGLQHYYKTNAFKNATPDCLIESMNKGSRTNLSGIFASWLDGKVIIEELNN
ncbi:MAG: M1 family metallopeptidase [Firmicutes bacterium]|nr:M1 family metallopeptidase [Bacillota bacterium]